MESRFAGQRRVWLALFTLFALSGAAIGLFVLADQEGLGKRKLRLECALPTANGLKPGTRVRVLGLPSGQVTELVPPEKPGEPVIARFWVSGKCRDLVRSNASGRVVKDGLVGERFLEVDPGSPDFPAIMDRSRVASRDSPDWDALADQLNSIVRDVQSGRGTVGKLLKDDSIHESIDRLIQKTDKVVGSLDENYSSMRQNSIVGRWMKDRYQLLVRPDLKTHRRVFSEAELFESGAAVLAARGVETLEDAANWIRTFDKESCELLVAGFAADVSDARLAELTTQKQAQAVLEHLQARHKIHKTGWISRRATSAYGFGSLPDPLPNGELPPRRIELIVFEP